MNDDVEQQAFWQQVEWALGEIEGGDLPPDVTSRVMAAVQGDGFAASPIVSRSRWLTGAAMVVLCAGAVVGVRVLSRASADAVHHEGLQDPGTPDQHAGAHVLEPGTDVASLPSDAREVTVVHQGDDVLQQLARQCPRLERLTVVSLGDVSSSPTDRVFEIAASLTGLRQLHLIKPIAITGNGIERLRDLPMLESLALASTTLTPQSFEAFPRLPSLRVLDLSYTGGLDDDAMRAVARCPGLRQLSIPGCKDITAEGLALVAHLTGLETLEARQLKCSFDALRIDRLTRLEVLDSADAAFSAVFVDRLPPSLTELTLSGTALDDDGCRVLRERLPRLRSLRVGSTGIGDRGIAELSALPDLGELDLGRCPNLTAACLDELAHSDRICRLGLGGLSWLRLADVQRLMARGIDVDASGSGARVEAEIAPLRGRYRSAIAARATRNEQR
ncbi:MAG TPA: hypothetical protein VFZ65_12990 [Planctomycetota bacterium]|nr:hypothetical protein [Planctomycetota bacterium]